MLLQGVLTACLPAYSVELPATLLITQSAFGPSTPVTIRERMITSAQDDKSFYASSKNLPVPHDLLVIDPNIKLSSDHVDVSRRVPLCSSVRAVRITKSDVHAGIFFVLQNLPNHILQFDIGANGKFADAIAVLIRVCVTPEITLKITDSRNELRPRDFPSPEWLTDAHANFQTWRRDSRRQLRQSQTCHSLRLGW